MRTERIPGLAIIKGMAFAVRQVFKPNLTVRYPEVVNDIAPRHRGRLVLRVLEALKVDRMVLLGHSFGGPIAIEAAQQAGSRAAGLALLASVGLRTHRGKREFPFWRALSVSFRVPPVRWALVAKLKRISASPLAMCR